MNGIQGPAIGEAEPAIMEELGTVFDAEFGACCEDLKARLDPEPSFQHI